MTEQPFKLTMRGARILQVCYYRPKHIADADLPVVCRMADAGLLQREDQPLPMYGTTEKGRRALAPYENVGSATEPALRLIKHGRQLVKEGAHATS